jgi:protein TonB
VQQVAAATPAPARERRPRPSPPPAPAGNAPENSRAGASQASPRPAPADSGSGGRVSAAEGEAIAASYQSEVMRRIRRAQRYPAEARASGAEGRAVVAFTIGANGGLGSARLAGSSGHAVLDRAALDILARAAPFPPIPPELGRRSLSFQVPLEFRIQ